MGEQVVHAHFEFAASQVAPRVVCVIPELFLLSFVIRRFGFLRGCSMRSVLLTLALASIAMHFQTEVEAGILFDGQTVGYEFYYPNNGTVFFATSALVGPGPGVELVGLYSDPGPDVATVDISDTNIFVDFNVGTSGIFDADPAVTGVTFNGFRIYDQFNVLPGFDSHSLGLGSLAAFIIVTENDIWVDLKGLAYDQDSFLSLNVLPMAVSAVPEPASAAFLGLGSLALVVRRLRRRTSVVA
jgi:hypothetical protein